jgi:hypothetical protein
MIFRVRYKSTPCGFDLRFKYKQSVRLVEMSDFLSERNSSFLYLYRLLITCLLLVLPLITCLLLVLPLIICLLDVGGDDELNEW